MKDKTKRKTQTECGEKEETKSRKGTQLNPAFYYQKYTLKIPI